MPIACLYNAKFQDDANIPSYFLSKSSRLHGFPYALLTNGCYIVCQPQYPIRALLWHFMLFNQIDNYMDSFGLSCSNQDTGNSAAFPAQTLNRLDYKKEDCNVLLVGAAAALKYCLECIPVCAMFEILLIAKQWTYFLRAMYLLSFNLKTQRCVYYTRHLYIPLSPVYLLIIFHWAFLPSLRPSQPQRHCYKSRRLLDYSRLLRKYRLFGFP